MKRTPNPATIQAKLSPYLLNIPVWRGCYFRNDPRSLDHVHLLPKQHASIAVHREHTGSFFYLSQSPCPSPGHLKTQKYDGEPKTSLLNSVALLRPLVQLHYLKTEL